MVLTPSAENVFHLNFVAELAADWTANISVNGSVQEQSGSDRTNSSSDPRTVEKHTNKTLEKPSHGSELSISGRVKCHWRRGQQEDGGLLTPPWRSGLVAGERSRSAGVRSGLC